ncbi:MAG: hypothetical protein O7D91_09570 [Planctomycetota bacterium]|nr:hypothetical protein [Planctomycetota bacterium]
MSRRSTKGFGYEEQTTTHNVLVSPGTDGQAGSHDVGAADLAILLGNWD